VKIKLLPCIECRRFPFVETFNHSIKHPKGEIKIFCEHAYFEGDNHLHVAENWNVRNGKTQDEVAKGGTNER
jgi:hypothetical protein